MSKLVYYIFNKPYNVLSQFTKEVPEHITLKDFLTLPSDVYPVGRLDKDSEGLLLLTNDNSLKNKLLDPKNNSSKTYLVQVEGDITASAIQALKNGVSIKLKNGSYKTQPCKVKKVKEPQIEERNPPVRFRAAIPTSWIEITIGEGKNRQIRKMCAQVGFPCLRLLRIKIKGLKFKNLSSGKFRQITKEEVYILFHSK
jgi:23S rRNA pseudouridine2457 synthase